MRLRRIMSVVLAACLLAALGTAGASAVSAHVYSVADIVRVARAIATQTTLGEEEMALYDANGDGLLTIADVVAVAEYVVAAQDAKVPAAQQPSAQPTVCPTCAHYPCVCSAGSGSGWGTQNRVCANCGQYPCVCGSGSGWGTHHGAGHHGGWAHC